MANGIDKNPKAGNTNLKFDLTELKRRLWFVLLAIVIFRVGTFIPVPGIDPVALARLFDQQQSTILGFFNMFSGGALERLSVFAMGVMPYISASIIMQLLTVVWPTLEQLKKEGATGQKKINQYTRYGTVFLASFQSFGIALALARQGVVLNPGFSFYFTAVLTLMTGTIFLMWLGEQVTQRGIGNGISLLIFAGIVSGFPSAVALAVEQARQGEIQVIVLLLVGIATLLVTGFVVFVERAQRRITVNYAKRQQGRKLYAAQKSHLPLKINMSGVIPPIFASSILLFPGTLGQWFGQASGLSWLQDMSLMLAPGQPLYVLLFALGIVFFCFFYTAVVFNPQDTADNLKRSGAFIPGIRPGEQTSKHIDEIMTRLTMVGAIYVTAVCLLPQFLVMGTGVSFRFGGTSLLIVVVVVMEFMAQLQSYVLYTQYGALMQKAKLVNR
ncbi:MAG: preprotein translocase subunit SecY [Gammaproteobacteria bacterium]|nr:preprotein translocase subunit SecY [Gammaproteobacteria bacterium]